MSIAAVGFTGEAVANLQLMVSQSVNFQKLVKAANAAAAIPFVHAFGKIGNPNRPFAIASSAATKRQGSASGSRTFFHPGGRLVLMLEVNAFWDGVVTSGSSTTVFSDSALINHADNFFAGLDVKFSTGANAGQTKVVQSSAGASGQIVAATAFSNTPQVGDKFRMTPTNDADAFAHFTNIVDALISDVESLSGKGGYINLSSIEMEDWGRVRIDQSADDYFGCKIVMEYGP